MSNRRCGLVVLTVAVVTSSGCQAGEQRVQFRPITESEQSEPLDLTAWWRLSAPQGATVVLVHGLRASPAQVLPVAKRLHEHGINTLRLALRGHGESGGDFPYENPGDFGIAANDVRGALRWLRDSAGIDTARIALFGISLGGGAALSAALDIPSVPVVAWYPGLTYLSRGDSLMNRMDPQLQRVVVLQGTADRNPRANPALTRRFLESQRNAGVIWFLGGGHGPGRDAEAYLSHTIDSLVAFTRPAS